MIYFFVYNVFQTSCFFFLEKSSRPHMSKVANTFCQPSVLIETPGTPYFFGYKTHPKLFNAIFLSWQTENQAKILGYKAQPRFLVMFTLTTTTRFPMMLIMAILVKLHLCEQKRKRLHILIKGEKITSINTNSTVF